MFIFPLIYLLSFLFSVKELIAGNKQAVLLFLIAGLSIYNTALSIMFQLGLKDFIFIFQLFKELIILLTFSMVLWNLKKKTRFHFIDYAVTAFFIYTLLYTVLPIGEQNFGTRALAFKSTSFFVFVYFTGRLLSIHEVYVSKYFHYILLLSIAAAVLLLFEVFTGQHFQTLTGYADYNFYFFNIEPTGSYGLSYTFESEGGFKRFASFFSNPLEHGAATIIALSVLGALYTRDNNTFRPDLFGSTALAATSLSIFFAISRAPLAGYFLIIYVHALLTKNKLIIYFVNSCILAVLIYLYYILKDKDIQEVIMNTIDFSNPSSAGHILEWIEGIAAMINNPLGLGLGTSGRLASSLGDKTGGENQFIIIGVQAGIIAVGIYISIYIALIRNAWKWLSILKGKERKVCMALLLLKIGLLIPLLTSEVESSPYIAYLTWFLAGLFVSIITNRKIKPDTTSHNTRHTELITA